MSVLALHVGFFVLFFGGAGGGGGALSLFYFSTPPSLRHKLAACAAESATLSLDSRPLEGRKAVISESGYGLVVPNRSDSGSCFQRAHFVPPLYPLIPRRQSVSRLLSISQSWFLLLWVRTPLFPSASP